MDANHGLVLDGPAFQGRLRVQLRITGTGRQGFDPQQGHAVTPRTRPLSRLLSPAIHQPCNRFTVQKLGDVLQQAVAHPVVVLFHKEGDPFCQGVGRSHPRRGAGEQLASAPVGRADAAGRIVHALQDPAIALQKLFQEVKGQRGIWAKKPVLPCCPASDRVVRRKRRLLPPKAPPQIRTRPFRASGSSGLRFCCPLLSATVALTRLLMTLSSSRVSQWQFRKPTPPLATHRLPRVGFPAFRRCYEGATTSSVYFDGLIAFGHRYLLVLSSFAHTCR